MGPSKLQPALLGGVAIGVLSSLPVVNIVNVCCCAWVIVGGALAAHLMQQNHPAPISAGDGAIVGLMAGAIGAVVGSLIAIPIALALGPMQSQFLERLLESANDLPPEARSVLEQMRGGGMMGGALGMMAFIFSLFFSLCVYSVFGLFGGLIGAAMFKKNAPPPPPPPSGGFTPPTFTPPSSFLPPPPPPPPGA